MPSLVKFLLPEPQSSKWLPHQPICRVPKLDETPEALNLISVSPDAVIITNNMMAFNYKQKHVPKTTASLC